MSNPSWRQFAAIPFDATVARVVRALAVEVPPEGRPASFAGPAGFLAARTPDGAWIVHQGSISRPVDGPRGVIKAAKLPAGTASGDALRLWLSWWGWTPGGKLRAAEAPEPTEQTRMVT